MVRTYATTRKTTTVINSCNHNQQYVVIRNQYLNGGSRSSSSSNDKPLVTSMSGNCFEDGASIGQIQCCLSHGSCSSAAREWCKTARGTTVRILALATLVTLLVRGHVAHSERDAHAACPAREGASVRRAWQDEQGIENTRSTSSMRHCGRAAGRMDKKSIGFCSPGFGSPRRYCN